MLKLVCFVYLVHLVCLVEPNKQDKPNNDLLLLADFFSVLLIAWWFEVARRPVLPGDGRLFGLLDEAAQVYFRRTEQLRFAALHDSGQQDVQRTIHPGSCENSFCDRIGACRGGASTLLWIVKQGMKRCRMAEEPRRGDFQYGGKRFELRGTGINLSRFNFL
jgi:hypothetical protein